jgi:signal transduction histidine kinase
MLFVAAVAVVVALATTAVDGGGGSAIGMPLPVILFAAIAVGLTGLAFAIMLHASQEERSLPTDSRGDAAELRKTLAVTEAILKAEQQILVFWEQGQRVRVVTHTLTGVPGVPEDGQSLERFGTWLNATSAAELKTCLEALFSEGRAFNILVQTTQNAYVEADGRAAGGRAILRLRDVVGYKRDLARILEQHRNLTRESAATKLLLDALPMPVWLRNSEGRTEWANAAYIKAVDASTLAEVREANIELLEMRQREETTEVLKTGAAFRKRLPLIIGGDRRAHDVIVLPLENGSIGAAIDAAAIESARGEVNRLITAYDRTLDHVATGVAIFGPDLRLTFFNDAFRKLWQLDPDWLATRPTDGEILDRLRQLSRLPEVVNYRDWKAKVLNSHKSGSEYEDWWHLPDGRMVHILSEQRPDGGVAYLCDDATERIGLEARYNALIDAQRETLDGLTEAVAVFAPDGRLRLFNSALCNIWRLSRATLNEGPHIDEIIHQCSTLYNDTRTWMRINHAVTGISDRRQPVEGQIVRPDESIIDFAASPLPDGATLLTFSDVTDAKSYERALIERNEALLAADRLKSQFISHVSYELRTPLTNIIGFSELLLSPRTGPMNSKQREYMGDIASSSKTLLSIINDILDLATIDAGALELKLSPTRVRPIIEAAVLGVRDRANRARLEIDVRIADDIDGFVADEARVRQILYNLLANAIGFSQAGGVIRVGCWKEADTIAITIEDHGVGIPKDQQSRVFDRFESHSLGSKHRGAGLGLAIVKSLVELHGGRLDLDSEPGRGTRVTVRLPESGILKEQDSEKATKSTLRA